MIIPQVSFNNNYPMANLFYLYIRYNRDIKKLMPLLYKYKILSIQLTTTILDNCIEGLILPKYIEKKF